MKLQNSESSGSIYESFSDLIFGTLIMMIVMVVFLVLKVNNNVSKKKDNAPHIVTKVITHKKLIVMKKNTIKTHVNKVSVNKVSAPILAIHHPIAKFIIEYDRKLTILYINTGNLRFTYGALTKVLSAVKGKIDFKSEIGKSVPFKYISVAKKFMTKLDGLKREGGTTKVKACINGNVVMVGGVKMVNNEYKNLMSDFCINNS